METKEDSRLIFIISQPRSGSTLLQRMLGNHSDIHTQSEPWILLHPLHALKPENIHSAFESDYYSKALTTLIGNLPGGFVRYREIISESYLKIYAEILGKHQKRFFLDKTPRYYYIIEELFQYFPNARFIFLLRNPAAVLVSMIKSWASGRLHYLANHRDDLLLAPKMLISGPQKVLDNSFTMRYEDLLAEPEQTLKQVCSFLNIDLTEGMIEYGTTNIAVWNFGDKKTIYEKNRPDATHIKSWQTSLSDPQIWRLVKEYVEVLGPVLIQKMGYSYNQIQEIIDGAKPELNIDKQSMPLSTFVESSRDAFLKNHRLKFELKHLESLILSKDNLIKELLKRLSNKENAS